MIITCPHCQTKYQVTYEAIGSAGRKVQCAHCQQEWKQKALSKSDSEAEGDKLFEDIKEDALDEAHQAEERAVAESLSERAEREKRLADTNAAKAKSPTDAAEIKKREQAFSRRQSAMISSLPLARLRRTARVTGILILVAVTAIAYIARVPIVERYPDMAGLYSAVGLGVNVVGLDFTNLETLRTINDGQDVLIVSAQILGLRPDPSYVPPVVVSLLDNRGRSIYEWSVTSRARDLMAGERATFETRLTLPPKEAVRVRLSFAGGSAMQPDPINAVDVKGGRAEPAPPEPSAPSPQHH